MLKFFHTAHTPNRLICFLLFVIPIMLLSMTVSYLFYRDELKHQMILHKDSEQHVITMQQHEAEEIFLHISTDLKILTEFYIKCFSREHSVHSLDKFTEVLRLFSLHRQVYDQIRLINKDGMEVIRINLLGGKGILVPKEKLQNKFKRYYFQDTIKIGSGEIFVSPFDLNMEHGEIEKPYKPMLRFATPVIDQNGDKQGILILNYLAKELLDNFAEHQEAGQHGKTMLLNRQGFWLYGGDREDNWAFMWPERTERTFRTRYPEAWKSINSDQNGQVVSEGHVYTFATISPLKKNMSSTTGSVTAFGTSKEKVESKEYYWKLISSLPVEQIYKDHLLPAKYSLISFNVILFFLIGPLSWLLIRFYVMREATRQELDHFRTVLDQTHDCVFMFDPETLLFTYVNQGGQNQVGYSKEEFLRMIPPDIKPEYTEAVFRKMIAPLVKGKTKHLVFETLHQHKNGTNIPVEIHLQYIHPAHGAACFVAIVRDITERKQAEEALKTAHQRLLTVLDGLDAIVYVIDMKSYEVLFVNKYAHDIFGDITGSICWKTLQKGLDRPCDCCPNELLRSNGEYAGKSYIWERENPFDGRWYEMHDRAIQWLDDREVKIQIATDITERRCIAQQLQYTAYHDSLTGVANRLFFYERFDEEVSRAEKSGSKLALIFIDLNNFKPINDQYGHDIGDILLQEVTCRLLSSVRHTDLVARMGGDEFVVLLPGIQNNNDVLRVLAQINKTLQKSCQLRSDVKFIISAAVGTAVYPDDGVLTDELLNTADQRMYSNKREQKRNNS